MAKQLIGEALNRLVEDIAKRGNAQSRSDTQNLAYRVRLIEEAVIDLRDLAYSLAQHRKAV